MFSITLTTGERIRLSTPDAQTHLWGDHTAPADYDLAPDDDGTGDLTSTSAEGDRFAPRAEVYLRFVARIAPDDASVASEAFWEPGRHGCAELPALAALLERMAEDGDWARAHPPEGGPYYFIGAERCPNIAGQVRADLSRVEAGDYDEVGDRDEALTWAIAREHSIDRHTRLCARHLLADLGAGTCAWCGARFGADYVDQACCSARCADKYRGRAGVDLETVDYQTEASRD